MKNFKAGFSLIEMLVAITLLTLLIGMALFSFKYQLTTIHKTQTLGINKAITFNQLRSSLQSLKYYSVNQYDLLNRPIKKLNFFFNATENKINYITDNALFSKVTALAQLQCSKNSLVYTEEPLYGDVDFMKPQFTPNSKTITLYKDLIKCSFYYLKNSYKYQKLNAIIPELVSITLHTNKSKNNFFISIKSDYNESKINVYNATYPNE